MTPFYTASRLLRKWGGYDTKELDDRGYVEPEPLIYTRFVDLAKMTAEGLKEYGMLSEVEEENLSRLVQIAELLLTISNKELQDEMLTDEEYDFIKGYGGNIAGMRWFGMKKTIILTQENIRLLL